MKKTEMHSRLNQLAKKLKLPIAALMISLLPVNGSAQNPTVIDLSTGVNISGGPIANGTPDDNWTIIRPEGNTVPALICRYPGSARGWIGGLGNSSSWITTKMEIFPEGGGNLWDVGGNYTYKMIFNITPCSGMVPKSEIFIKRVAVDNKIVSLRINNGPIHLVNPNGLEPPMDPAHFTNDITVPIAPGEIISGNNEIKIVVYNNNSLKGNYTPQGLNMEAKLTIFNNLTPVIQGPTSFCANAPLTFTGSIANGSVSNHFWEISECDSQGNVISGGYLWSKWLSGTPGGFIFPVVPPCDRYYKIKLAFITGCQPWAETASYIYIKCGPVVDAGADLVLCPGQTKTVGINTQSKFINFSWSPSNWLVLPNGKASGISIPAGFVAPCPTSTTYVLTATSVQTGCSSSDAVVVSYATQPSVSTISQSGGHGGCNFDVTLAANACGQGISYYWENGTSGPTTVVNAPQGKNINLTTNNVCFTNNQSAYANSDLLCFHPRGAFPALNYPTNLYINWSGHYPEGGFIVYDQTKAIGAPRAFNADRLALSVWKGGSSYFTGNWQTEDCEGFRNTNFFEYNCVFNGSPLPAKKIYDFGITLYNCNNSMSIYGQFYIDGHKAPENVIITADAESLDNLISVYPTAASTNFTVNINSSVATTYSVSMWDALGKQVTGFTKSIQSGSDQTDIDVSNFKNGVYFVNITDGVNIKKEKIVVSH